MSVSGISSSSFHNQNIASIQSQQQQFQKLVQEFESGDISPAQTTALQQNGLPTGTVTSAATSAPGGAPATSSGISSSTHTPVRTHHLHHSHQTSSADSDGDQSSTSSLEQLDQPIQSGNTSSAQQAYGGLQQGLQQVALSADLLNAQSGALQSSGLSLIV